MIELHPLYLVMFYFQLWALMSEDTRGERYARLQYLLRKSNMYTEYLIQRMESQRDEEKAKRERMKKRKENKEKKEVNN